MVMVRVLTVDNLAAKDIHPMSRSLLGLLLSAFLAAGCASEVDEPSDPAPAPSVVIDTDTTTTQASRSRAARQKLPTPTECQSACLSGRNGMTPEFCDKSCNPN